MSELPWWHARAGGRRKYNAMRRKQAAERRRLVLGFLVGGMSQSSIAILTGVDKSTICRDVRWLGKLPDQVRTMPGGKVTIAPNGWKFSYSFAAWRGLLPGKGLAELAGRIRMPYPR